MELLLVLHAHLPWVKDPAHPASIEERWLFEAMWESYLPLLGVLDRAAARGQRRVLTLSLSPTLLAMLADERLRASFEAHVEQVLGIARAEARRSSGLRAAALADHVTRLEASKARWDEAAGDVARAFAAHHQSGVVELITTAATHAFLPGCRSEAHVRAQLTTGRHALRAFAGVDPAGMWLPECAYDARLDPALAEGVGFTILDGHALELGRPRSPLGVFAPVLAPCGTAVFARDDGATRRVWSRRTGYPGDPEYREFHRDLSDEIDPAALGALAPPEGARAPVGLRLFRVTGREDKESYDPARAAERVAVHAAHFLDEAESALAIAPRQAASPPILCAPYDAELFGHWWWEGPAFLDAVLEGVARRGGLRTTTPSDRLARHPELVASAPAASSWGEGGFARVWTSESTAPMLREVHRVEHRVERAFAPLGVARREDPYARALRLRARDLAARELMLAAASDWAFLVATGTNVAYAQGRAALHVTRATELAALAHTERLGDAASELIATVDADGPPMAAYPRDLLESAYLGG